MSDITERWRELDDGTRTLQEVADACGCSTSNIVHLRRDWLNKQSRGNVHCRRCDFYATEKVPFVEEDLCLWCWLDEQGIDLREFYESGTWQDYVSWRPGAPSRLDEITLALKERILAKMDRRGEDFGAAARRAGCHKNTWWSFLSKENYRLGATTAEAAARYLGITPNAKGIASEFHMHPRRVAILIRGW